MWSSKDRVRETDRQVDIACRKSTPNALDDAAGLGLGEVNHLLEQHFAHPVAPPVRLTLPAVRELILTAPPPAAPTPWYRTLLQPGRLTVAAATGVLAAAVLAYVPAVPATMPALEATVYARTEEAGQPLPSPEQFLRQAGRSPHQGHIRIINPTFQPPDSTGPREYITIVVTDGSRRALDATVREFNASSDGLKLIPQFREGQVTRKLSVLEWMELMRQKNGTLPVVPPHLLAAQAAREQAAEEWRLPVELQDERLMLLMEQAEARAARKQEKAAQQVSGRMP